MCFLTLTEVRLRRCTRLQVRWYGEGSSGLRVWDFGHADHEAERAGQAAPPSGPSGPPGPPQPHRKRYRCRNQFPALLYVLKVWFREEILCTKEDGELVLFLPRSRFRFSGSRGGIQRVPQGGTLAAGAHPDCILTALKRQRQKRSAHATLITRDCAGNPLEPPGVRLSPGPPRPRLQPRAPVPPAPREPWRQDQAQTSASAAPGAITDVYLQMNKRVGAPLDPPRGFEASAEQGQDGDQEVQEDHLRGESLDRVPLSFPSRSGPIANPVGLCPQG